MEKQIFCLIKMLSIGHKELKVNFKLSEGEFDSIELLKDNSIVLHRFEEDWDFVTILNYFDFNDQKKIYDTLKLFLYN